MEILRALRIREVTLVMGSPAVLEGSPHSLSQFIHLEQSSFQYQYPFQHVVTFTDQSFQYFKKVDVKHNFLNSAY